MTWRDLFERAAPRDVTEERIRAVLAVRRGDRDGSDEKSRSGGDGRNGGSEGGGGTEDGEADDRMRDGTGAGDASGGGNRGGRSERPGDGIARIVADADVLAADLLVGGSSRAVMDVVRGHSWVTLVASDPLLDDAAAVVAELADPSLAADWREAVEDLAELVDHPAGDHPALASAYRGGARHVVSVDESMRSAAAAVTIRSRVETSVKHPDAFARLFDPVSVYQVVEGGDYGGPDRDPRG